MSTVCGVRISKGIGTVGIALLLAACGAGETARDTTGAVHLESLRIKLDALMADSCNSEPESMEPWQCEKYVTQLANMATTLTDAAESGIERLAGPGQRMTAGVSEYRAGRCAGPSPVSEEKCVTALTQIADAVSAAERAIGD